LRLILFQYYVGTEQFGEAQKIVDGAPEDKKTAYQEDLKQAKKGADAMAASARGERDLERAAGGSAEKKKKPR
jgi:hypothetical protein